MVQELYFYFSNLNLLAISPFLVGEMASDASLLGLKPYRFMAQKDRS